MVGDGEGEAVAAVAGGKTSDLELLLRSRTMRLWPLPSDPVARPPVHGGRALAGPTKPGGHIKADRRDAKMLAALFRAGELQGAWVPDAEHEAVRELARARQTAMQEVRRSRQLLLSFLLRHDRATPTRHHWTRAHRNWLARQSFAHPTEQVVFEELIQRIELAAGRQDRLEDAIRKLLPAWSLAPVVAALQSSAVSRSWRPSRLWPKSATSVGSPRRGS